MSKTLIFNHTIFTPGSTIIVGLSGGPDSVALVHYLVSLSGYTIIAAHLDHGWRETSEQDAQFCAELCKQLGVTYTQAHLRDIKTTHNGSPEDTARRARRAFLEQCAREYHADVIALAHHRDDQRETFFLRLIRGAGLTGLAGMHQRAGLYVRPLLAATKADILAYLHTHNISYCTDITNTDQRYLRNRIRQTVVPALDACDTRALDNLDRTMAHLQEVDLYLDETAQKFYTQLSREHDELVLMVVELSPVMRHRVLLLWLQKHGVPFTPTESFFDEMVRFLRQPGPGKHAMSRSWSISKKNGYARIVQEQNDHEQSI